MNFFRLIQKRGSYSLVFFVLLWITSCAKIGSPDGGPKDTTAPQTVGSIPKNHSKNFRGKKIEIQFDEFINLKNATQELVVSPPLKEKPEIKERGKKVIVDFGESELDSNTTYTFSFGNSIVDFREGNPIENYEFVFSTGDEIDSMRIGGKLFDAKELKMPEKKQISVLLYSEFNDSTPYKNKPDYVAKVRKDGSFDIGNIAEKEYHIFALEDKNGDYLFNGTSEAIAFIDSIYIPKAIIEKKSDTLYVDTTLTEIDTILIYDQTKYLPNHLEMALFVEDYKRQKILDKTRKQKEKCTFIFSRSPKDEIKINLIEEGNIPQNWKVEEFSYNRDTVNLWLKDSTIFNKDTLLFSVEYQKRDSLEKYFSKIDTVKLVYKVPKKPKLKKDEEEKPEYLHLKPNTAESGTFLEKGQNLQLRFSSLIKNYDKNDVFLYEVHDTTKMEMRDTVEVQVADTFLVSLPFDIKQNEKKLFQYEISASWEEEKKYHLFIKPQTFESISYLKNDTTNIDFRTRKDNFYGEISLTLSEVKEVIVLHLLDKAGSIIRTKTLQKDGKIKFENLKAGSYGFKLFFDKNKNGKWDTGKYLKKLQPEKIKVFKNTVELRSGWEHEVEWDLSEE